MVRGTTRFTGTPCLNSLRASATCGRIACRRHLPVVGYPAAQRGLGACQGYSLANAQHIIEVLEPLLIPTVPAGRVSAQGGGLCDEAGEAGVHTTEYRPPELWRTVPHRIELNTF
jgi:hypothetical protein